MDTILFNSSLFRQSIRLPPTRVIHNCFKPSQNLKLPFVLRLPKHSSSSSSSTLSKSSINCAASSIEEVNESQFADTVLKSDRPVLVEFVANWCGPCRLISPAIQSIAQEYSDRLLVIKIDHDANPRLIEEYKVYGLPTLILFKNGQEVPESRREGAITKVKLKEYVDGLLDSISVV